MHRASDDTRLDEARDRMTALAVNLTRLFAPLDVAALLAGAAVGVMTSTLGRAKAAEFFTEIAVELGVEEGTPEGRLNDH